MATGHMCIFITPSADTLAIPPDWIADYTSDAFTAKSRDEDRFALFDHAPNAAEIAAELGANERQEELRQPFAGEDWASWRLRVRFPVEYTTETCGGIARIFKLSDPKLPASWGNAACFWWVHSTAAKLKLLHTHIYTTLGFGPVAGALAALDPADQSKFLPGAVQAALTLTNPQQLARVTAIRNALVNLGYTPANLSAMVAAPAGKTEDDLIRALVADLGFTMPQLFRTMIG